MNDLSALFDREDRRLAQLESIRLGLHGANDVEGRDVNARIASGDLCA
jgi:hypothetical protein